MPIRRTTRIGHPAGLPIHDGELAIGGYTGLPIVPSGSKTYESYIESLGPLLWLAMTGTGATEVNKGTVGATLDGTITTMGAQAIAGKIAADSAHLYDATASVITVPNDASINALSAFTYVKIAHPFSFGDSAFARLFEWGDPAANTNLTFPNNSAIQFDSARKAAATNAASNGSFSTRLIGKWSVVFETYDDAGDRKIRLYSYVSSLVEAGYGAQTAAVGALTTEVAALSVGNRGLGARPQDGLYDEFMLFGKVLPDATMERIGGLALARRWNSYSQKLLELN